MLSFLRITYLCLTFSLVVISIVVLLIVEEQANIQSFTALAPRDIERAKQILDGTFSRSRKTGSMNVVSLTERDIAVASNYLLKRYANGAASVDLDNDEIRWRASLKLQQNPLGNFINVNFRLKTIDRKAVIDEFSIGDIQFPAELTGTILRMVIDYSSLGDFHALVGDHIKTIDVNNQILKITYRWSPDALNRIKAIFTDSVSEELLLLYHNRLVEVSRQPGLKKYISLNTLMEPMFKLAHLRSKSQNPVQENKALMVVMGTYVNGRNLEPLISATQHMARPQKHGVMLNKRIDSAKHFMTSAVLAVSSGTDLANIVGLYKELTDSKVGSGFSFIDLAADRAGTRFGSFAVSSQENARAVQQVMGNSPAERSYMPKFSDLPESLDEASFHQKFGNIDSPAYKKMVAKIDGRISGLDLYR